MQVNKAYKGPVDCISSSIKQEGVPVIYRGLTGTMAREIPGNMSYFSIYEVVKFSLLYRVILDLKHVLVIFTMYNYTIF